jgi:internalin A
VVTNKCDEHHLELNQTRLKKDYPDIRGFYDTSCLSGDGVAALKSAIQEQIHGPAMRHIFDPVPGEYFAVKQQLEALAEKRHHLSIQEYYTLCGKEGLALEREQNALLRFLHDLGSVLSFNDPANPYQLRQRSVFNPSWVTLGVYRVLNSVEVAKAGGVLGKNGLERILDSTTHPTECHGFIMEMMKKFELCYDIETDKSFLVPDLLPKDEPFTGEWDNALTFQIHYNILPNSVISRFIVRMNTFIHKTVWRSGVVLKSEANTALVKSGQKRKFIFGFMETTLRAGIFYL